jgi:hypothetical protein
MFPGATVNAATRKAVASLRDSRANWSPDELIALNDVAKGSPTRRTLRMVGALAPNKPDHGSVARRRHCDRRARNGRPTRNDGDGAGGQDRGQSAHEFSPPI